MSRRFVQQALRKSLTRGLSRHHGVLLTRRHVGAVLGDGSHSPLHGQVARGRPLRMRLWSGRANVRASDGHGKRTET